jgi:hypothetical protein
LSTVLGDWGSHAALVDAARARVGQAEEKVTESGALMGSRAKKAMTLALAGSLGLVAPVSAATIDILALADAYVSMFTLVPLNPPENSTHNAPFGAIEGRSVYEFDLPVLTEVIVSATFVATVVRNFTAPGDMNIFGFSGNGTIEGTDANQTSNLIGTVSIPNVFFNFPPLLISVPLSASFVAGLGSGFLGLTTVAALGDSIDVASLENPNVMLVKPTLRLETQAVGTPTVPVPEPGSLFLLSSAIAAFAVRARRKAGQHNG